MSKDQTTIAGERTQDTGDHEQTNPEPHNPGSERGGYLHNGKTAREWFELHEVMRGDFKRVVGEKEELRQDYGRVIKELEGQDGEIRKHEALEADRLSKLHPKGVKDDYDEVVADIEEKDKEIARLSSEIEAFRTSPAMTKDEHKSGYRST